MKFIRFCIFFITSILFSGINFPGTSVPIVKISQGMTGLRYSRDFATEMQCWLDDIRTAGLDANTIYTYALQISVPDSLQNTQYANIYEYFTGDNPPQMDEFRCLFPRAAKNLLSSMSYAGPLYGQAFRQTYPDSVFNFERVRYVMRMSGKITRMDWIKIIKSLGLCEALFKNIHTLHSANPNQQNPVLIANYKIACDLEKKVGIAICIIASLLFTNKNINNCSYKELVEMSRSNDLCKKIGWCLKYLPEDISNINPTLTLLQFLNEEQTLKHGPQKYTWWEALKYFCGKGWCKKWICCLDWWIFAPIRWILGSLLFIWRLITWAENWGIKG